MLLPFAKFNDGDKEVKRLQFPFTVGPQERQPSPHISLLALAYANSLMLPTCVVACLAFVSPRSLPIHTSSSTVSTKASEYEWYTELFNVLLLRDFVFLFTGALREVVNTVGGHVLPTIARVPGKGS